MCNVKEKAEKQEFPAKGGEHWYYKGEQFTIGTTDHHYFETSGNPDALYVSMRDSAGKSWVITQKAFIDKFKREEPIVDRYIIPNQILKRKPCSEGVMALGNVLVGKREYSSAWEAALGIQKSGNMNNAFKVSELYAWYKSCYGREPANEYLLFLAKALNLVPESSNGPDRATLKRLLGIKE